MRKLASTSDRTTHRERPPAAFRRFLMHGVDRRSLQAAWRAPRGLGEKLSWHVVNRHVRDRGEVEKCPLRTLASTKKPPGNRVAFSLGRIVPTEARPSELSWRHSMGGLLGCQGQIIFAVNGRF